MDRFKRFGNNLKTQAEANPIMALSVAAGLLMAVSKLIDANTARGNAKAWQREVDRRMIQTYRNK